MRTVSLLPAATEIVAALGLLDQLVAVSHDCDYPPAIASLPRVTRCEIAGNQLESGAIDSWVTEKLVSGSELYTIDEQLLRSLEPELILTQKLCDVCAPSYDSVAALASTLPSKPRVINLEPASVLEVFENIELIAAAMNESARGTALREMLEARLRHVRKLVSERPPVPAFVLEWIDPLFNTGHWTPELIAIAGGVPVLSPSGVHSTRISWDQLRAADPAVIIVACCGYPIERTLNDIPMLRALPGWKELNAASANRVFIADGASYFSRPGPRIVETAELIAALLHPEVAADLAPAHGYRALNC